MQIVDKRLIAPKQFRIYLILHHCFNLIHGVWFCYYYLDNLINGKLEFRLAWFRFLYLFFIFILSLVGSVLQVLIIPQLITLNNKNKRDLINSLKLLLKYKLNQYIGITEQFINFFYFGGSGLMIWDIFGTFNEEIQVVIYLIRYSIYINLFKYFLVKYFLEKNLEKSLLEEEQNQFIQIYQLKENSAIIKEECPICYDSFKSKDFLAQYLCAGKHNFHKECLIKWLKMPYNKQKTCPYCKQQPQDFTKAFL
ncbi:unnamed protein product [Paramecium sonneborni]|uniref:RING-type E3 ubiquitin transferase n=1 Tax=Paramecium sonneborni TaxID=65129 RepID=A0A8S1MAT8_9CILI|nr:unnamed protein product [Paramecium sonneborni]